MVKFSGLRFQFCVNVAIYPRFLVRVGFNRHRGNNIPNTLNDELSHRVCVYVKCYSQRLPGTFPSLRDQNNLEAWILIGLTSVE